MTIKNLYPKARPHIIYNVINGRPELPAASTFSRASIGTYVDRAGIIQTAAADEPRFNYDPETGESLGLLIEESRTNFTLNSNSAQGSTTGTAILNSTASVVSPRGITETVRQLGRDVPAGGAQTWRIGSTSGGTPNTTYTISFFAKTVSGGTTSINVDINDTTPTSGQATTITGEWTRITKTGGNANNTLRFFDMNMVSDTADFYLWGVQVEAGSFPTSYIPTTGSAVTREADAFSLTSSSNFDNGFSFLLDSNTITDDFIYKIKAGGSTIAELNNDNGTLDWVIDGTSAATSDPPQYPQIGAIQPGRVRTVSSFGAAGDGDQTNYLYTESLSFPTVAEPAAGADELEFGTGQTVKAVYVWDGQLSNTEAVSVIKGEYNIILNEPIQADTYSFVYNTDTTNVGEASITLPYIVPTVSMRVYWGDTTSDRYEPGVTPSHTYPYPGQYRIQIEADDGFDGVRLADVNNSIQRVDQWAPQHRVGAAGDGFTGDDFSSMLYYQTRNQKIPPFKYTNLTNINGCFYANVKVEPNNWDWVPTQLQNCITINNAFDNISRDTGTQVEFNSFPQLQTSSSLTSVKGCFSNCRFEYFDNDISGLPFTVTSSVTRWDTCFTSMLRLLRIGALDTSAAINLSSTFRDCTSLAAMPFITTNNVTNFSNAWEGCSSLTNFPQIDTSSGTTLNRTWYACNNLQGTFPSINTSSVTNFTWTWRFCGNLTGFPLIDTSSATTLQRTWESCTSLAGTFPLIVSSSVTDFSYAWNTCSSLTGFQQIDTSSGTNFHSSWRSCGGLTAFPAIDTSSGTTFNECWQSCTGLTTFPPLNMSSGTNFFRTWRICTGLTSFPPIDVSSGTNFSSAWEGASSLNAFPANMFDTTGTLIATAFSNAWFNCALTAQSIENILVSLDTNGASNITLSIDGGTNAGQSTWTAAANTAYTNLINKGWAITARP